METNCFLQTFATHYLFGGIMAGHKGDIVFEKFKSGIEAKGMTISSIEEDGLINIDRGDTKFSVSLDNVRRNYEGDGDEQAIIDFVESLVKIAVRPLAGWDQVREHIYATLMPLDSLKGDPIYQPITMVFGKVYVYTGNENLTFIDYSEMERWGITLEVLQEEADKNTDLLLEDAAIKYELIDGRKLGFLEFPYAALKTSLLFAPSIRRKVEPDFGFPFYAVLPVRDFCYIFSETDFDFFAARIGRVIVDEYRKSGYPLTTEVIRIDENSADAVGAYPVE